MDDLLGRLGAEQAPPAAPTRLCRGTLLSRAQYLVDIEEWGVATRASSPRSR